jgi:hypothetical protein
MTDKSFTLRVTTHGAGACVEMPTQKQYSVFFCDAGRDFPHSTMYIRFPKDSYRGHRKIEGAKRSATLRHIRLDGERLLIRAANVVQDDQTLTINKLKDPISSTPTAYDNTSLYWLPAINDLAPGHGKLDPGYMTDPLHADPPLVARLDLTQGRLGTTGTERMQIPFRKEHAKNGVRRAIARELLLQMEVLGDHVVLESHPLDGSQRDASKDMRFDANGAETLEIVIGNEPDHDIYEPVPPTAPIDVLVNEAAKEYKFYYRLCATPPGRNALYPFVKARPNGQMNCTQPRFNDGSGG